MADTAPGSGPSIEELVSRLGEQAATLVRQELMLARRELADQLQEAGIGAGMLAGAGLLGVLSAGGATAGLILLLARRRRPWLAALTVSGGYAAGAALLAAEGRRRLMEVGMPVPEQTLETLKETARWPTRPTVSKPT